MPDSEVGELDAMTLVNNISGYLQKPYSRCFVPEDEGYSCYVRELHGCMSQGTTLVAAYRNLEMAMSNWIEAALSLGQQIPEPEDRFWPKEHP